MLGSIGFAVWYGWHVTSNTLPKIIDGNRSTIKQLTDDFRADMKQARIEYREELAMEREHCLTEITRSEQRWTALHTTLVQVTERLSAPPIMADKDIKRIDEEINKLREWRHKVANDIQASGSGILGTGSGIIT